MKTTFAFSAWRRATCATETPGATVCRQIDRFSSTVQSRFVRRAINRPPAGLPDGAAAARWFKLVHLRMPADLRRDLFGADRLSLSRAEALTGISRRTLKRHLPNGGWW